MSTPPQERTWDVERLDLALAAARLGDWRWDVASDVITLSPRAAEIYGVPPGSQMTRTRLRDLLHPDDRERARVAANDAQRTHADYIIEYRVVSNGGERWIAVSGRGLYDEHGAMREMFGVVQDITNDRLLVRLDDAVRPLVSSEDITYTAARTLGQHLGVNRCAYAFVEDDEDTFDLTGNYNDGVESIVGRYRFRQFGAECLRLMRANEPYIVEDSSLDRRLDDDDRRSYELTAIRAVICVPIHKSDRFVAAMAVHTKTPRRWLPNEVTLVQQVASRCWESIERARVERERLSLLQAAQAANRTKDEFLAMLGHELRNPLAPILTALELMRLRGDTANERERTIIQRQVRHLTRLVDDLLDVSRIARGLVDLKREPVELSDVVLRAIELASPLLEQRSHSTVIDVPRMGLVVDGDAARLTQAVSNLLTNAAKYTPPGGRIVVTGSADGDEAVLRLRDNGRGIDPDVLPHVFDLFVQGDPQTIDRAHGGLGLGLAIVKNLVTLHGGSVAASSEGPGKGSELVVRLPLARTTALPPAAPAGQASAPLAYHTRVLVVDDNEDAADLLGAALEMSGCDVKVAHDGHAALELAERETFDAALLDIGLPVMDGYELAQRLRALPAAAATKLIAITGYGQQSDRRRALDAGFHHHLVKPVDLRAIAAIVADLRKS